MKRLSLVGLVLMVVSGITICQEPGGLSPVFQPGEMLQYEVKWGFLRLGTITVRTLRDSTCSDPTVFKLTIKVESNPDLKFVWIWEYNESLMDAVRLCSRQFRGKHINGEDGLDLNLSYDAARKVAAYSEKDLNSGACVKADTLRNVPPYVEGPSLFFFTRCQSQVGNVLNVPTLVNGQLSTTALDFTGPIEFIEFDAIDQPVRARKYTGSAKWKGGAAGLSGDFAGWISDDEAAVPIRAEMGVILGSIRVELEQWIRGGWAPPIGLQVSDRKLPAKGN